MLGPAAESHSLYIADATLIGESSSGDAGAAVSSAGDFDADGYTNVLVGSHDNDDGGSNAGKAYLILSIAL